MHSLRKEHQWRTHTMAIRVLTDTVMTAARVAKLTGRPELPCALCGERDDLDHRFACPARAKERE